MIVGAMVSWERLLLEAMADQGDYMIKNYGWRESGDIVCSRSLNVVGQGGKYFQKPSQEQHPNYDIVPEISQYRNINKSYQRTTGGYGLCAPTESTGPLSC